MIPTEILDPMNNCKINEANSYDNIQIQNDLLKILAGTTSDIAGKPDAKTLKAVFSGFDRLCSIKGNLQYYLQLMYKIMKKSIYCRVIELPEILLEQLKERDFDFYSNSNKQVYSF
jgi:hypothetical protein